MIHTDEHSTYQLLNKAGYGHKIVSHGVGEYVNGDCHVNSLESFWARLKNSVRGTHIHVSKKHLDKYAKEFEFRYNSKASLFRCSLL